MSDRNYSKPRRNSYNSHGNGGETKAVVVSDEYAQHEPVQAQPLEVKVYNNSFDKALRAFRALVQKERVLSIYKDTQSFEKPSDKRRRKRNEMKRKRLELDNPRPPREPKKYHKPKPKPEDTE